MQCYAFVGQLTEPIAMSRAFSKFGCGKGGTIDLAWKLKEGTEDEEYKGFAALPLYEIP